MKYTIDVLVGMDLDLVWRDGDKIVIDCTNGGILDKYLELDEDEQDELFDYLWNTGHKSDYTLEKGMKEKYPCYDSFTDMAESGFYAYDEGVLVASPTNPLLVQNIPEKYQKMLNKF